LPGKKKDLKTKKRGCKDSSFVLVERSRKKRGGASSLGKTFQTEKKKRVNDRAKLFREETYFFFIQEKRTKENTTR